MVKYFYNNDKNCLLTYIGIFHPILLTVSYFIIRLFFINIFEYDLNDMIFFMIINYDLDLDLTLNINPKNPMDISNVLNPVSETNQAGDPNRSQGPGGPNRPEGPGSSGDPNKSNNSGNLGPHDYNYQLSYLSREDTLIKAKEKLGSIIEKSTAKDLNNHFIPQDNNNVLLSSLTHHYKDNAERAYLTRYQHEKVLQGKGDLVPAKNIIKALDPTWEGIVKDGKRTPFKIYKWASNG